MGNFNSQPHKEADRNNQAESLDEAISTHSLTRRLTGITVYCHHRLEHFNSQPHKEADTTLAVTVRTIVLISTHSLTRRLTQITL